MATYTTRTDKLAVARQQPSYWIVLEFLLEAFQIPGTLRIGGTKDHMHIGNLQKTEPQNQHVGCSGACDLLGLDLLHLGRRRWACQPPSSPKLFARYQNHSFQDETRTDNLNPSPALMTDTAVQTPRLIAHQPQQESGYGLLHCLSYQNMTFACFALVMFRVFVHAPAACCRRCIRVRGAILPDL